jgi:hypothetical protein
MTGLKVLNINNNINEALRKSKILIANVVSYHRRVDAKNDRCFWKRGFSLLEYQ